MLKVLSSPLPPPIVFYTRTFFELYVPAVVYPLQTHQKLLYSTNYKKTSILPLSKFYSTSNNSYIKDSYVLQYTCRSDLRFFPTQSHPTSSRQLIIKLHQLHLELLCCTNYLNCVSYSQSHPTPPPQANYSFGR